MLTVSAPGKIMLSGEWSVLELGIPCIVFAVDKRVTVKIEEAEGMKVSAPDLAVNDVGLVFDGKKIEFKEEVSDEVKEKLAFARSAVEIVQRYLHESGKELGGFALSTHSDISAVEMGDGSIQKVGFGSSAATVVAIAGALMKLSGEEISSLEAKEKIYKLGCAAHYFAQGKVGSAFDVAASTYGGAIVYKKFDAAWLVQEIESGKSVKGIVEEKWKDFMAKPIALPEDMRITLGYTGKGASTKELVIKMKEFKKNDEKKYWEIMNGLKSVTEGLIAAIEANDKEKIFELIKENRKLLKELNDESGNNLETDLLAKLADVAERNGAAGKFCGAGGGDCGIAVSFDAETEEKIKKEWEAEGLHLLDASISEKGVD